MFNELVAYEYLGQYDKAKLAMDQYLALYPDDEKGTAGSGISADAVAPHTDRTV